MTFASENPLTERIRLTSEQDSLVKEKSNFANVESVRTTENAENSDYSVRVSAYSPAVVSKVLRIEKGGSLSLRAAAKYEENKSILLKNNKLMKFKAADLLPLVAVTPVNFGNSETKNYAIGVNLLGILPVAKKIVNVIKSPIITPKKLQNAVIEISFYKDSLLSEQIFSKQIAVSENAAYDWEILKDSLIFEESGFVRVTLRNSNSLPVLFDNLELRTYGTQKARIIQENHYEPFGMTLQGLDYVAENTRGNKFLYNGGVERQEELGLYWDDSHARAYNMQTGRFEQIDPLSEKYTGISGYNFSFNNPTNLNDPSGLDPAESLEQWSARIQSEWARIDAGENPFDVWGFGGHGNSSRQGKTGAWEVKRGWKKSDLQGFADYVTARIHNLSSNDTDKIEEDPNDLGVLDIEMDCADVPCTLLIGYAYKNGLAVSFTLANGKKASSTDTQFSSGREFLNFIKDGTCSASIQADMFTVSNKNNLFAGDMTNTGTFNEEGGWSGHVKTFTEYANQQDVGFVHSSGREMPNLTHGTFSTHTFKRWNVFNNLQAEPTYTYQQAYDKLYNMLKYGHKK